MKVYKSYIPPAEDSSLFPYAYYDDNDAISQMVGMNAKVMQDLKWQRENTAINLPAIQGGNVFKRIFKKVSGKFIRGAITDVINAQNEINDLQVKTLQYEADHLLTVRENKKAIDSMKEQIAALTQRIETLSTEIEKLEKNNA